ncbi:LexA family transcriptional regulator [Commensalibacter papalotli (ex Botero et al. 2024)]|uniref:LexA family transcriptional regulator n=1 Tax=Commensalibacter papalotli (ex Botero et al. 2024) TaxID=2972766 RepID=UPI0022FF8C34|nr:LexA family transcriptional regulator [Commensalibacter papalotli (ex Botero et al. 2024)]CAI3958315.1 SOS-response transcriptional repressor LexA (RecA-mediated autopeptidase) (LexA) (PDB:1AY9) [Commensalibacter papalotli (ex Botero et al. 2024)]
MSVKNLHALIKKIAEEKNASLSGIGISAGVGPDFIRKLEYAKNGPPIEKLIKLAHALNVDINIFLKALDHDIKFSPNSSLQPTELKTVYIRGEVQAGKWTSAIEWPREEWIPTFMPPHPFYEKMKPFALKVKGDSMNLKFPDGSIVVAVNFCELGRNPEDGECVVTIRRDPLTDNYEATLKIVQIRDDGSVFLWPRSNNPDFIKPIQLPRMTTQYQGNGFDGDTSSAPDVMIQSLVISANTIVGKDKI